MGNNIEQENRQEVGQNNKIIHTNPHAMKAAPPIMYEATSPGLSQLRLSKIQQRDLNNYIHTKIPIPKGSERYSRDHDYAQEEVPKSLGNTNEESSPTTQEHLKKFGYKRFQPKVDDQFGMSYQISVSHFDYAKKLNHFVKKPQRVSNQA